ncbi:MAG TPA: MarR family transcriptional regulator [Solirubrobacteraceae bacterium]|jgi:DNA-binding MarR family transcriptional regulator
MSDAAHRIWQTMRALVLDNERRKEACDALAMSFVRVKALRALADRPMTARDLAAQLSTDPPYTTLILDDLQERGMVTRTAHPSDRRAKIVSVTPSGLDAAHRAQRILDHPPAALRELTHAQLATLEKIMAELESLSDSTRSARRRPRRPSPVPDRPRR